MRILLILFAIFGAIVSNFIQAQVPPVKAVKVIYNSKFWGKTNTALATFEYPTSDSIIIEYHNGTTAHIIFNGKIVERHHFRDGKERFNQPYIFSPADYAGAQYVDYGGIRYRLSSNNQLLNVTDTAGSNGTFQYDSKGLLKTIRSFYNTDERQTNSVTSIKYTNKNNSYSKFDPVAFAINYANMTDGNCCGLWLFASPFSTKLPAQIKVEETTHYFPPYNIQDDKSSVVWNFKDYIFVNDAVRSFRVEDNEDDISYTFYFYY